VVKIFVSYSHDDEAVAQAIEGYLRKAYDDVWYDEKLHTGDSWWERIVGKIENCSHFIFLMSNESLKSEHCQKELAFAREKGKVILPIKVRRSIDLPDNLKYLQSLQICEMLGKVTLDSLNELYAALVRKSGNIGTQSTAIEAHREADLDIIKELWGILSSDEIDDLLIDIHLHIPIKLEAYGGTISHYIDLRQKPNYQFYNHTLEQAFDSLDKYMMELNDLVWECYTTDSTYERMIQRPDTNAAAYRLSSCHDDTLERLRELRKVIRSEFPDFVFPSK
jgi:hypothetical protein